MPDLKFDFKWYRDAKGYRLIPAKPTKRRPGQSLLDEIVSDIEPAKVARNGGALQSYRPLDVFPHLFEYFVTMPRTENGVLEFVKKYGPLTSNGLRRKGDVVPEMIDQAAEMSQALRGRIVGMPLRPLNASIVSDNGKMRLKISPACLLDAIWLQLVQEQSAGAANLRECDYCHKLFMAGVGTDRRADAKFCSDKHRIEFNSLERRRKQSRRK